MEKEKFCEKCGKPMLNNAVMCMSCGAKVKKPIFKEWWFWLIIAVVIIALGNAGNNSTETPTNNEQPSQTQQTMPAENITYEVYTVSQLLDDLANNALKAEETYKNKHVEITGTLSNIDSDGSYISLSPTNNSFTLVNVQCYIKNEEQKARILELEKGDTVTIKGKIKSIGELLGYSIDIHAVN